MTATSPTPPVQRDRERRARRRPPGPPVGAGRRRSVSSTGHRSQKVTQDGSPPCPAPSSQPVSAPVASAAKQTVAGQREARDDPGDPTRSGPLSTRSTRSRRTSGPTLENGPSSFPSWTPPSSTPVRLGGILSQGWGNSFRRTTSQPLRSGRSGAAGGRRSWPTSDPLERPPTPPRPRRASSGQDTAERTPLRWVEPRWRGRPRRARRSVLRPVRQWGRSGRGRDGVEPRGRA